MKKIFCTMILMLTVVLSSYAREPYGDYICRYICTSATDFYTIYNPIKISHYGIMAKNTNQGTKTWEAKYQGTFTMTNNGGRERFHNFYLTNQHVEFSISDRPFVRHNGKMYYMIIFDGQVQLAEPQY